MSHCLINNLLRSPSSEHVRLRPPAAAGHRGALPVAALHHALLRRHAAASQPRVEAVLRQRRGEAAEAGAGAELPHGRGEGEGLVSAAPCWWPGASKRFEFPCLERREVVLVKELKKRVVG